MVRGHAPYPARVTVEGIARKLVAAVVIGLSIAWVVWAIGGLNFSDADAYRLAADRLVAGQDIYVQATNQDEAFRYAPWFAVAWIPAGGPARAEWATCFGQPS